MTIEPRMAVDRASANDVMELVCDVSGTSMQVAAVLVLQSGSPVGLTTLRTAIKDRLFTVPRMRQMLLPTPFGCGRPVWIDDSSFDIDQHVTTVACSEPGDDQAMLDQVAHCVTVRLPPGRPLWSATLITGLTDGRTALVLVFHHVLADGIGGLAILSRLVDGATSATDPAFPLRPPSSRDLLTDAWRSRLQTLRSLPATARRFRAAAAELGTGGAQRPPRSSLNLPIGRSRALAVVRTDLAAVHSAAHAQGGTVNDVVLTAVVGALRTVLAERGETVDRLVVSMPVTARQRTSAAILGNQVGVIPVSLPTTGRPSRRLAETACITRDRKTGSPGSSAALLGPVFRALAMAGMFGWFVNRQHLVNTFVSNLRGPTKQLLFLGKPVLEVLPVSAISGNITVAFAAMSYQEILAITVVADPERCPDLPRLATVLGVEFEELTAGARTTADSAPASLR